MHFRDGVTNLRWCNNWTLLTIQLLEDFEASGGGMRGSRGTGRVGQAWGKAAAAPNQGDPLPYRCHTAARCHIAARASLRAPRAHPPIAPHCVLQVPQNAFTASR